MRHLGNVLVTHENYRDFPPAEEIFGHVDLDRGLIHDFTVNGGRLESIRGWLILNPGIKMIAPSLGLVDGWLELKGTNVFMASGLRTIRQDLIVHEPERPEDIHLPNLTTVNMGVVLWHDVMLDLPSLETVGNISLRPGAKLVAPQLRKMMGSLTMQGDSTLFAPELGHIERYVDVDPAATVVAPKFGRME